MYEMWQIYREAIKLKHIIFEIDDVQWTWSLLLVGMAEELQLGYDYKKMLETDFSVEEYMGRT